MYKYPQNYWHFNTEDFAALIEFIIKLKQGQQTLTPNWFHYKPIKNLSRMWKLQLIAPNPLFLIHCILHYFIFLDPLISVWHHSLNHSLPLASFIQQMCINSFWYRFFSLKSPGLFEVGLNLQIKGKWKVETLVEKQKINETFQWSCPKGNF